MRPPRYRWRLKGNYFSSVDQIPDKAPFNFLSPLELVPGDFPVSGKERSLLRFSRVGNPDFWGVQSVLDYLNDKGNPYDLPCLGGKSIVSKADYEWFFQEFELMQQGELPNQWFDLVGSKIVPVNGKRAAFIFGFFDTLGNDPDIREKRWSLIDDLLLILNRVRPISVEIPFFYKGVVRRKEDYELLSHYLSPNSQNKTDWRSLVAKSA